MNWISRNQKFLEPPWFTIQPKFFQPAACIIENIGVVVTVKPSHDDIKHDPGAFTSDHLDDAIDPLFRTSTGDDEKSRSPNMSLRKQFAT